MADPHPGKSAVPASISFDDMLAALGQGEFEMHGLLPYGSNYTFLVSLLHCEHKVLAVYKPVQGERPLWDFPDETLALREVAAFLVSNTLGWDFVPPTVYRDGPHGPGSVQWFVDAQDGVHYFTLGEADRPTLQRVALFDVLINNADRKGGHIIRDKQGKLWCIDHGVCFHSDPKLRTVVWDFAGEPIPDDLLADLRDFRECLAGDETLRTALDTLLTPAEVASLRRRTDRLLRLKHYPDPGPGRNFPWPPV
jgi:uncharacterized repeat protein (TIGR03843 family)